MPLFSISIQLFQPFHLDKVLEKVKAQKRYLQLNITTKRYSNQYSIYNQ
jgi:hypothetical protein